MPVLAGWVARAVVIGGSIINTRLLIDLAGVDGYAAISIVLSLAPWLVLFNLGLPNTTQNLILERRAKGRETNRIQHIAVGLACTAGLIYLPVALLLAWLIDRYLLSAHVAMSLPSVVMLLWAMVMLGLTAVFHQVLHALHRSTWPSVAPAVQVGLTLLFLLAARVLGYKGSTYALLALAIPMMLVFVSSAVLVRARPLWRPNYRAVRCLLHFSRGFLMFGITGSLALSCDYIVMSQLLRSTEVAQYNLVSKTLGTVLTLHAVLLATSWSPLSDYFFRRDFVGVRHLLKRLLCLGGGLVLVIGLPLALFMDRIAFLLSGGQIPTISWTITVGWLLYIAIRVWSDTFATALLSFNHVGAMNRYVIWQSGVSLSAQWILGRYWGAAGIVAGVLLSFLLTAAWILPMRLNAAISSCRSTLA